MKKDIIEWFERGFFPIFIGFTMSEKAFKKEMERMKLVDGPNFLASDHADATMHHITNENGSGCCIVTLCPKKSKGRSYNEIIGLLAHESVHVMQFVKERIGEIDIGKETEAYYIQHLLQCLLLAYEKQKKR